MSFVISNDDATNILVKTCLMTLFSFTRYSFGNYSRISSFNNAISNFQPGGRGAVFRRGSGV
jgi:hypothetical protein